jgi:predicted transcriptional regulator
MNVTTVRLQPEIEESLQAMAGEQRRTKSWLINEALRKYIQHQEQEQVRWQGTLVAMESVAQGHTMSNEAVHSWLGSWGDSEELPSPKAGE